VRARLAVLAALLLALGWFGIRALGDARRAVRIDALCSADDPAAAAGADDLVGSDALGREAALCRCRLYARTGDEGGCVSDLEAALAGADDWLPPPPLTRLVVHHRADAGRLDAAAALARRSAERFPDARGAHRLEWEMRSALEPERAVLDDLAGRLGEPTDPTELRLMLADRYRAAGATDEALAVLGDAPPAEGADAWFEQRLRAHGRAADASSARATLDAWIAAGGAAAAARAIYALVLDEEGLQDPDATVGELYVEAVEAGDAIDDPWIREAVRKRLIIGLVRAGRAADALALYDETREEFALVGLTREEIENEAVDADPTARAGADGALVFRLATPVAGAVLSVSGAEERPLDTPWEELPIVDEATARRVRTPTPVRWVLRDGDGEVRGSGTVRPRSGRTVEVEVTPRPPSTRPPAVALTRRPADGRRRVFALVVDCLDWRIVQYLRHRGELPTHDALIDVGRRAVLWTDPPYTAAAMKALVKPGASETTSVLAVVHELGLELAGLESVPSNPVAGLAALLPVRDDLFERIGAGPHATANLLFPHGAMDAGAGGARIGPRGARGEVAVERLRRPVRADEMAAFPGLEEAGPGDENLQRIAAAFDTATAVAEDPSVDLVVLRVEAFDNLTHGAYAVAAATGQDDGAGLLFATYRYADRRIAEVAAALDEDDVFVLLSDHGIRTAMEHDNPAFWLVVGPGVEPGTAPGQPAFEGVPRALAELLGAEVPDRWPEPGVPGRSSAGGTEGVDH